MVKKVVLFLLLSISLLFVLNIKKGSNGSVLYGDALGYYLYLPSAFIYNNLDTISQLPENREIPSNIFVYTDELNKYNITPTGHVIDQYTFGVAIMELPFFVAGHLYAKATGQPANGFSKPYQNAIRWSSVFYAFMGLLILYNLLKTYFNKNAAFWSIIILFLCSNLFWFTLYQAGMSHLPLFFLFSLLLYLTVRLYEKPSVGNFILVGLTCGLITYIRPVDIICIFIPLFYGIYNKATFHNKLLFIQANIGKIALAILLCFLIWVPQMIYWKIMSGSFLYDSYGNKQTFDFTHPRIWEGLFSASNGWLFYSPALIIFLPGLFLWKQYRPFAWVIFITIPIYWFLIYSWFVPNYINGLGSRPMVDVYALVAIPVAAFIAYISTQKKWIIVFFSGTMLLGVALNFSFMIQEYLGVSRSEYNNSAFAWQMLFRYKLKYNDLIVNDIGEKQPDTKFLIPLTPQIYFKFNDTLKNIEKDNNGNVIYNVSPEEEMTPIQFSIKYDKKNMGKAKWLKGSGFFKTSDWADIWTCQAFIYTVERGDKTIKWKGIRINNKIGKAFDERPISQIYSWNVNLWGEVYFYSKIPDDIQDGDEIKLKIANSGRNTMQIKDVYIQLFK